MGIKILIAIDDKENREQIKSILTYSKREYRVISTSNTTSTLQKVKEEKPHLIIIDYNLDNSIGILAINSIKKVRSTATIPILIFINSMHQKQIVDALDAGALGYLQKPINRKLFITKINSIIDLIGTKVLKGGISSNISNLDELHELSSIAKEADNSIIIIDPTGNIEWANKGFARMYGYTPEEYNNIYKEITFEILKNVRKQEYFKINKSINYENEIKTKSGEYKWVQTTLTPVINENNDIEKYIAVETDITKLKEIEDELIQKSENILTLSEHLDNVTEHLELQKKEIDEQKKIIEKGKQKSEKLLMNILPYEIGLQLKSKGYAVPRHYRMVSVMFTNFKGYTKLCQELSPQEMVSILHTYFAEFDDIVENHYIEKIKTIGDTYMAAGGIPLRNRSNPIDIILAALEIQKFIHNLNEIKRVGKLPVWELKIGIHTGEVVAGVVGKRKFAYDIWGDTVNIASNIEAAGEVGKINITSATYEKVKDYFNCEPRGMVATKDSRMFEMYFLHGLKPEYSTDPEGYSPNKEFLRLLSKI
ncbi:MAG: response regulator [Chlorobi bacterium]|nr:response regulator [Chlorobiota bacterium]